VIVAVILILASYEYTAQVSANVANLSIGEIHSNARIEASDLAHILQAKLESVSQTLNLIASSSSVTTGNVTGAAPIFDAAQNSSSSLTTAYYWIGADGRILLLSTGTSQIFPSGTGFDLSNKSTFTYPKANLTTYFSGATPLANSSTYYIFISRPVFSRINSSEGTFSGVVAASIPLKTMGEFLLSELSPSFKASVGMLDFKGGILYSSNDSAIGQNVFKPQFQSEIPTGFRSAFDAFLNESLKGNSGLEDLSYNGASGTLAYQPIFVNATTDTGARVPEQFGVLYVSSVDTLASSATSVISQQQLVSIILILVIAGVSGGLAVTTLRWNKRLDDLVNEKTSELVRANSELEAKGRAEKDLMNVTAHELRTPTQSILTNSEILQRVIRRTLGITPRISGSVSNNPSEYDSLTMDITPEEIVDLVDSSVRNASRLQNLTNNILEVARIDNKTIALSKEIFDLNEAISEVIHDARIELASSNEPDAKTILFEPKQPTLFVDADRTKVSQIILNLLSNALKYTKSGGKIEIKTDSDASGGVGGKFAVVSVIDNGTGIDPDILSRLFTKFVTKSGTGLGLYITKSYVEAHGGVIQASNDPAGGAIFTFTIPLAPVQTGKNKSLVVQ